MKSVFYTFIIFLTITFSDCSNTTDNIGNEYKSIGIITGYDLRECACCGGWFIAISDSIYRFYELPKENNIDFEKDTLPMKVKLDWKKSPSLCIGDEIIVIRIKKY